MTVRVGIVDTTFARVDMAKYAIEELRNNEPSVIIERITVPGFKNTPWAAKQLINKGVDAVMVLGWIGPSLTDKITYAVTSMGLIMLQIEYDKPIVDVTIHEDEANNEGELFNIAVDRTRKHARNLILMLRGELTKWAGMGLRQGRPDAGPIM
ncbi:riboflavin synthase [Vulcanisaeta souniana]|uniref:Riboflavin synthase n=1 Tax=Vulcanisaeta souniana JCM 11219 TaxID=1293586 RepID=A0ABN6SXN5_9CREN|nr:riboflavin synthase [Vulcanisaeta souniana]BDR93568.1 riboflavin synthase [Vulcanisaeta souniana JCM 11219]